MFGLNDTYYWVWGTETINRRTNMNKIEMRALKSRLNVINNRFQYIINEVEGPSTMAGLGDTCESDKPVTETLLSIFGDILQDVNYLEHKLELLERIFVPDKPEQQLPNSARSAY